MFYVQVMQACSGHGNYDFGPSWAKKRNSVACYDHKGPQRPRRKVVRVDASVDVDFL